MTPEKDLPEEVEEPKLPETAEVPVPVKKPKFTPPPFSFGKNAAKFNPPNKQRPGHHAGRGR